MHTSPFITLSPASCHLLLAVTAIIVAILLACLCRTRHNLSNCHYVIVRLIGEKEELLRMLPPQLQMRYHPDKLSRTEILSILKIVRREMRNTPRRPSHKKAKQQEEENNEVTTQLY